MATTYYSADPQTFDRVVAAVAAGKTIIWQVDSAFVVKYDSVNKCQVLNAVTTNITAMNPDVVVVGTSGLAAALNGQTLSKVSGVTVSFTWNGTQTQGSMNADDFAYGQLLTGGGLYVRPVAHTPTVG